MYQVYFRHNIINSYLQQLYFNIYFICYQSCFSKLCLEKKDSTNFSNSLYKFIGNNSFKIAIYNDWKSTYTSETVFKLRNFTSRIVKCHKFYQNLLKKPHELKLYLETKWIGIKLKFVIIPTIYNLEYFFLKILITTWVPTKHSGITIMQYKYECFFKKLQIQNRSCLL